EIQRPRQEVWDFLFNLENLPKWSPDVKSVRKVSDTPRRYLVSSGSGEMETEILAADPPRRYVSRMATPSAGFSGDWEITLEPEGANTRVSSNAKLRIDNPLFRGLMMFMSGDKAEEATLVQLKQYLEAQVR
ncbi:MAG: SRPBCC family protein, partial [Acidobacteriota bacterium]